MEFLAAYPGIVESILISASKIVVVMALGVILLACLLAVIFTLKKGRLELESAAEMPKSVLLSRTRYEVDLLNFDISESEREIQTLRKRASNNEDESLQKETRIGILLIEQDRLRTRLNECLARVKEYI